jgi:mannose-6-phosphate isomerase-like protein (cupin superfamily)
VEGETVDAIEGEIVIVPAGRAHRFVNLGPDRACHVDIHTAGRMTTEWVDENPARPARNSSLPGTAEIGE